ncbi:MAG: hypothetical protein E6R03_11925 [Hyphomicrobiaceae bacterium]|nr:MAG: hypothetical protein E6R03_11925 [Hyphomicrobiaceae bacterium]
MPLLFLDCETYARPEIVREFTAEDNPIKTVATNQMLAQVVCVVMSDGEKWKSMFGRDERKILLEVNATIRRDTVFVTFAGRSFDLPLLYHRMVVNGIKPHDRLRDALSESRYRPECHLDLQELMSFQGVMKSPSLWAACLAYGIKNPKASCSGNSVQAHVESDGWNIIAEYCRGDVQAVIDLYTKWSSAK